MLGLSMESNHRFEQLNPVMRSKTLIQKFSCLFYLNCLMAGWPVYLLIFLMPSPRLGLRTLAGYTTHLENYMLHLDVNLGSYFVWQLSVVTCCQLIAHVCNIVADSKWQAIDVRQNDHTVQVSTNHESLNDIFRKEKGSLVGYSFILETLA